MKTAHTAQSEKDKYNTLYKTTEYAKRNLGIFTGSVDSFCQLVSGQMGHVIELGAGRGEASLALIGRGFTVTAVDIADEADCFKIERPNGYHAVQHCLWEPWPTHLKGEWFFSADFMEHLPPERVDEVFSQLRQNIRFGGLMQICTVIDTAGATGKEPLHLTVENAAWWTSKATNYYKYVRVLHEDAGHVTLFMRNDLGN